MFAVFRRRLRKSNRRQSATVGFTKFTPNNLPSQHPISLFTLDQINDIHDRLGKQATLPDYLRALKTIGVDTYDSFITDGHSAYFGKDNQKLISPPVHRELTIAKVSDREGMLKQLDLHNQGKTDYLEMSRGLADNGVEKWTFNTGKMTITYYGLDGREMLLEAIK